MSLDKSIALVFLVVCLIYGYAAFNYPLLPFERNMAFLPNTMPLALSVLGAFFSVIILLSSSDASTDKKSDEGVDEFDLSRWRDYEISQAVFLVVAMLLYAVLLRPLGFIPATVIFLSASGWILGERKLVTMLFVASVAALAIWLLVQEVLGIYLKPLPWFIV